MLAKIYREGGELEKSRSVMKLLVEDTEEDELKELLSEWEQEDKRNPDSKFLKKEKDDHKLRHSESIENISKGRKKKEKN